MQFLAVQHFAAATRHSSQCVFQLMSSFDCDGSKLLAEAIADSVTRQRHAGGWMVTPGSTTPRSARMGRALFVALCSSCLLLLAATSRSDVALDAANTTAQHSGGDGTGTGPNAHGHRHGAAGDPPATAPTAPVTNMPPTQSDPGSPAAQWSYEQLSAGEQAYVDRAASNASSDQTHSAFARAVGEQATVAAASAAANELGVDNLASQGVVQ